MTRGVRERRPQHGAVGVHDRVVLCCVVCCFGFTEYLICRVVLTLVLLLYNTVIAVVAVVAVYLILT